MVIFGLLEMKEAKYGVEGDQIWLIFCFAWTKYFALSGIIFYLLKH